MNPLKIHTKAFVLDTNRKLQSDLLLCEHFDEMKNNFNLNELSWLCTNCITKLKATVNKDSEEQTNEESASAAAPSTSTSLGTETLNVQSTDEELSIAGDDGNFSTSDDDNLKEHSMEVVNEVLMKCDVTPQKSRK